MIENKVDNNYGNIVNINKVNGNFVVNINMSENGRVEEVIIFLKIEWEDDGRYIASLEVETTGKSQRIVERLALNLDKNFFKRMNEFEEVMNRRSGTRAGSAGNLPENLYRNESVIGAEIYRSFFNGEMGNLFEEFFRLLDERRIERLTLTVSSEIPEILNIPFELLRNDKFYSLESNNFKVVHTTQKELKDFSLVVEGLPTPLKILFIASLPPELDENNRYLELEKEEENLIDVLGDLVQDKVLVEFAEVASLKEIEKMIGKGKHNIVHISGHGKHFSEEKAGVLCLEDEEGNEILVTGEELATVLKKYTSLKMVVLSACETAMAEDFGVSGALTKAGIPAVLAMRYPVTDKVATLFTSKFYEKICYGESFGEALYNARKAVFDSETELRKHDPCHVSEWATPFLYLNQNLNFMVDFDKKPENNEYFKQKPENIFVGGKLVARGFIGRHKELLRLTKLFRTGKKTACIYGMGGLGKTTLAIRFSDNYENGTHKSIQFIGSITEEDILKRIAKNAAKKLGNEIMEIVDHPDFAPEQKLQALIDNYLSKEKMIIIFDNFEDNQKNEDGSAKLEIASNSLAGFLDYFCKNLPKNCYLIFTTRYCFSKPNVEYYGMGEMNFPDSYKIMNRLDRLKQLSLKERREVYRGLGGHPKALELLEKYLENIEADWSEIEKKFKDVEHEIDKETNKALLFDMLIRKLDDEQLKILKTASVFRIPRRVEALSRITGTAIGNIKRSLETIDKLSLIYFDREDGKFAVHRLTANYVIEKEMNKNERRELHIKAADEYLNMPDGEGENQLEEYLEARYHYIEVGEFDNAAIITIKIGHNFFEKGYANKVLELIGEISSLIKDERIKALTISLEGEVLKLVGKIEESIRNFKFVLNIALNLNEELLLKNCYNQLGLIYMDKGELNEAEQMFLKILSMNNTRDISFLASNFHNLGMICELKGHTEKAINWFLKSIEIEKLMNNEKGIALTYNELGRTYKSIGNFHSAREYFQKAIKIFKCEKDIRSEGKVYLNLGLICVIESDYQKAKELIDTALEIAKATYDEREVGECYYALGKIYSAQEEYEKSMKYFRLGIKIAKRIKDKNGIADIYMELAAVHCNQSNYRKAMKRLLKAEIIFSETHNLIGIAEAQCFMASANYEMKELEKAKENLKKSMLFCEECNHKLIMCKNYRIMSYISCDEEKYTEALEYTEKTKILYSEINANVPEHILEDIIFIKNKIGENELTEL